MDRAPGIDHDASFTKLLVGRQYDRGAQLGIRAGEWFQQLMKIR
jgi:hypothetical protein